MTDTENADLLLTVEKVLDDIRPHLMVDGGNIEIVELTEEGVLKIKWLGNCESCSMSLFTMKAGIEQAVIGKVPHVTSIIAVNGVNQ
ncbi:MAG: NifU family protein [Saprospiraceae bacterium]|jgi:Fe-S cluster biogenesis protein NfuA|nr:NifU family protein [Saprospiraceae bacterium]